MTARLPIVLDVDTGIDDSLALLYAAASPEAELVAVTCCAGNVGARQVAVNTLAVLELAGRPVAVSWDWVGACVPVLAHRRARVVAPSGESGLVRPLDFSPPRPPGPAGCSER